MLKLKAQHNGEEVEFEIDETKDPAIAALIRETSKTEKNKLYQEIDQHKLTAKQKEDELKKSLEEVDQMREQLAAASKGSASKQDQPNKTALPMTEAEIAEFVAKANEKTLAPLAEQLKNIEASLQETRQQTIEQYLASVRAKFDGTAVPELIAGSTKAEIDASVPNAQAVYKRYNPEKKVEAEKTEAEKQAEAAAAAKAAAEAGKIPPPKGQAGGIPDKGPAGDEAPVKQVTQSQLASLPPDEYKKARAAIMEAARNQSLSS